VTLYDEVHWTACDRRLSVMREQRGRRDHRRRRRGPSGRGHRSGGRRSWRHGDGRRRRRGRHPDGGCGSGCTGRRDGGPVDFVVQQGLDDGQMIGRRRDWSSWGPDHGRRWLFALGHSVARHVRRRLSLNVASRGRPLLVRRRSEHRQRSPRHGRSRVHRVVVTGRGCRL